MPRHVALPTNETTPSTPQPESNKLDPESIMADRLSHKLAGGGRVYLMRVKMRHSNLTALVMLAHDLKFTDEQFQAYVREACKICDDVRIHNRRHEMARQQTPVEDPVKINETLFEGDVEFAMTVMADKWGFRRLIYTLAEDEINPTVVL